jgi:type I restriction enzyme S subunit
MNRVNVPQLRFQEFSEVSLYKKYSFNDVFQFSTGKNIKQNEASPDFETPCVRYGELYHMYNEVIYKVINKTSLDKSELHFSKGDEILLPSAGEDPLDIGSASALTIENIAIGRTINILRPIKENVYSQFYASYYINHKLKKKISKLAKGSSISNVYNSDLKTLEIILPDFSEQQKIASFLSALDEKIQQLSRKKELLEKYKKGVMQQLFSGKLRFAAENGEDYADWEEKKLGDLGIFKGGGTPSTEISEYWDGDIPWISSSDLIENDISNINVTRFITEKAISESATKLIPVNSVLFISRVGVGKLAVSTREMCTSQDFANFIPNEINSFYLAYYFLENNKLLTSYAQGTSIKGFTSGDLKSIKVSYPVLEEQQKIANFLSSIDTKIESTSQQINQTQSFKKGLLQQLFV